MIKGSSRNTYLNQFKNGRLRLFTKLYLRHCGKRDARKKIIREDEKGVYTSPFVYQEIHLYNLAFHIEEEHLVRSLMTLRAEMGIFQLKIEQKEQNVEGMLNNNPDFEQAIGILKAKKVELSICEENEIEIVRQRGKQLYSILQAKISAYWGGVLQVNNNDYKLPPMILIDQLAQGGQLFHGEE